MTIVLNFGHPLSADACEGIAEQVATDLDVRNVRVQLDPTVPLAPQVEDVVVQGAGLTAEEWATSPLLVVLPGMAVAAGLVLAAIHGRRGGFVPVVHLVRGQDGVFRLGEVISLAEARETARLAR